MSWRPNGTARLPDVHRSVSIVVRPLRVGNVAMAVCWPSLRPFSRGADTRARRLSAVGVMNECVTPMAGHERKYAANPGR